MKEMNDCEDLSIMVKSDKILKMTVKFLCKLFQRAQRRLDQDCIVKRCNYIRCLDGMKSISKRLWFKVAVQSMTGFIQHSSCWRKFKYATYKKVFVSNCRVYWMERMIDRKELSIVVLVWVWKILRMSVQILCKQFWRMKMREGFNGNVKRCNYKRRVDGMKVWC